MGTSSLNPIPEGSRPMGALPSLCPPEQSPAIALCSPLPSRAHPSQVNCKDGSAGAESNQQGSLEKPIPTALS